MPLIGLLPAFFAVILAYRTRKEIDAVVAAGNRPVHVKTKEPIDRGEVTDHLMRIGIVGIVYNGIIAMLFLLAYIFSW